MSLLLLGETQCPLCRELIHSQLEAALLPPFLWNSADDLQIFNDASLHRRCLDADPRSTEVLHLVAELLARTGPGARECAVCGHQITDPDDHLLIPPLTRDKDNPLYPFRYVHIHRSHLSRWPDSATLVKLLRALPDDAQGDWGRERLISELERAMSAPAVGS